MQGDLLKPASFWLGLLLLLTAAVFSIRSLQPPDTQPADAPAEAFSGMRSAAALEFLLGDETPHPVGSPANHAVRDRLLQALTELGLAPVVQRTVGCSEKFALCANVENVLAEIPGTTGDALVLMAHYDSVPHAPGAADDGSGVATILEAARVLMREAPYRNRILLLFTDAEEVGLLGAEAFFAEHHWAASVKAVVNLEGSGSGGPSILLRSSNPGGHLLRAYRETAEVANAYSYSQEVFARMPNDTDFTVPDRAGIASIDFAFAFEFNHYHTPLDTLANLDKGTLQHHGDNALPLARRLADLDLNKREDSFSYLTIEQTIWLTWPEGWTVGLTLLGLAGLGVAAVAVRSILSLRELLAASGIALATLLAGCMLCFGALWIAGVISGTTVSFPANPWPWRLLIVAGAILPVTLAGYWVEGRLSVWSRFLGAWLTLGAVALALAIAAPLAANLLVVPLLAASLLGCLGALLSDPAGSRAPLLVSLSAILPLAYPLLAIAYAMEETQGFSLAPVIFINVVLVAVGLLPLSCSRLPALSAGALLIIGWLSVAISPLYSAWRPQHLSFYYVLDRDNGVAQLSAITANPLPESVAQALSGDSSAPPVQKQIAPWASGEAPTAVVGAAAIPEMEVQVQREGQRVHIQVRSNSDGAFTQLILPGTADVTDFTMAGRPLELTERNGHLQARFYANGNDPVEFEFTLAGEEAVEAYLVDGSHRLPEIVAGLAGSRGILAVPRHQGDQRLAFQRISI